MRGDRRGKRERRGLEAIFTPQNDAKNGQFLAGATGIVAGLALSILAAFRVEDTAVLGAWGQAIYFPLAFGAIGLLLLTCGVGTTIFAFTHRGIRLEDALDSHITGNLETDPSVETRTADGTRGAGGPSSRIGAVAFIQSFVLVVLFAGFVQEYESNFTMQTWVRSTLPAGHSVLSWEAVLTFSVVLGLLLLQFLPERYFSE